VPRPATLACAAALAVLGLGACRPGDVRVDFRPHRGAQYRYVIDVQAATTTALQGRAPTHNETDQRLTARHTVEAVDTDGVTVDVRLTGSGSRTRSFEVRLDRAGSLAEVQRVEDIPAEVLGDIGISEVFPAGAGAPPNRPLRPGATWRIRQPVTLPGTDAARLTGTGRLVRLGTTNGRDVATVKSTFRLPVHQTSQTADGTITLDGEQVTDTTAVHAVDDGAVESVRAHTVGTYRVTLAPPAGVGGEPITGRLQVDVQSTTTRSS
jgi:hypothetical protein